MLYIVVLFLGLSLLMYCLFGGADFGAGILEAFVSKRFREKGEKITYQAIGPVWEANHIWLILVVVILFTGFPRIYSEVSVALHIPLTVMLIGIVLRGCFFTFRHYDAVRDRSHDYYSRIFVLSSIGTSLFLGVIAGALSLGRINHRTVSFADRFLYPWFNYFSFSVGLFACCIFAFLAAVYLIGESKEERIRKVLLKQAFRANLATAAAGPPAGGSVPGAGHAIAAVALAQPRPRGGRAAAAPGGLPGVHDPAGVGLDPVPGGGTTGGGPTADPAKHPGAAGHPGSAGLGPAGGFRPHPAGPLLPTALLQGRHSLPGRAKPLERRPETGGIETGGGSGTDFGWGTRRAIQIT
jgi:hypothetical protein